MITNKMYNINFYRILRNCFEFFILNAKALSRDGFFFFFF